MSRTVPPTAAGSSETVAAPSATRQSAQFFWEEVQRLSGVVHVERCGGEGKGTPTFLVHIRPDDPLTEGAIYEVKGQAYDRYPDIYLDVVVLETTDALPAEEG